MTPEEFDRAHLGPWERTRLLPSEVIVFQLCPYGPEDKTQPLVTVYADGRVDLGPEYKPDRWARAFWDDLAWANPWKQEVEILVAHVRSLQTLLDLIRGGASGTNPAPQSASEDRQTEQPDGNVETRAVNTTALRPRFRR